MKQQIEWRANSLSTVWHKYDAITVEEIYEVNAAYGWQKFRIVEAPDDETQPAPQEDSAVPEVPEQHYPRMGTAQIDFETVPDVPGSREGAC